MEKTQNNAMTIDFYKQANNGKQPSGAEGESITLQLYVLQNQRTRPL